MHERQPSQTAMMAAAARAAHLVVDNEPYIFQDSVAMPLLGDLGEEIVAYHRASGDHVVLSSTRAQVTARSRYTEDRLAELVLTDHVLTQYVILGAGLDTFAYRAPLALATRLRVFEVDHPATQRWKRDLLAAAQLTPVAPDGLAFVGTDFETDPLTGRLTAAGFDPAQPALVSWLGVTFYLTRDAIVATLGTLGSLAPGTELVVEYALPPELRDARGAAYAEFALPAAAERGEPWLTFLTPEDMSTLLRTHGFEVVKHLRQHDAIDPALWQRSDALRPADVCRLVRAVVAPR
ncbi:MAG TPA: class I SAM-dependent methyltransferase [Actinomycetota bacterium]